VIEHAAVKRWLAPVDGRGRNQHRSVAAVRLSAPLGLGDKIHIRGHTTDLVQVVASMEVEHARVDRAGPGDDVALEVNDHVRDRDLIFHDA